MKAESQKLALWLASSFFEKGAFLADSRSNKVILARGGHFKKDVSPKPSSAFYLKNFFSNDYLTYVPEEWFETTRETIHEILHELPLIKPQITNSQNFDDHYAKDFDKLKASFGPDLQKAVLVSREVFEVENAEAFRKSLFRRAFEFGTGLPYGIWNEDYGVVGSTPEVLFSVEGSSLKTFALAGTSRLGNEAELLKSQKERVEHNLVTQDITEKLSKFSDKVSTAETGIVNFKNMIHLKTDIEAELKSEVDVFELASILSPTAALGGYPKQSALAFLQSTQYQMAQRERYFGSTLGLVRGGLKEFVVSIRNVQWRGNSFFIESGGGVVPASELEKELAEIRLKRETIKTHYL